MNWHFQLSIFIGLCLFFSAKGHDECPDGDWNKLKTSHGICWRESNDEKTFHEGVEFCKDEGHNVQVIPVGELRHLRNSFDRNGDKDLKVEFENRNSPFFVNAVKSRDMEWIDIDTKETICFHHFPHFKVQNGEPGDSLIWNPRRNELLIADRDAKHRVLCFWKKHKKDEGCPGHNHDNVCNQAGDCIHGTCHCDEGFRGTMCHSLARRDVDLIAIGSTSLTDSFKNVVLFNFETNTTCDTTNIPEALAYPGQAGYFDEQAHYCIFLSDYCYIYNPELNLWLQSASMSRMRLYGSAVLVPNKHSRPMTPQVPGLNNNWPKNYHWWATGGFNSDNPDFIEFSTELLQHGEWNNIELKPNETNLILPKGLYSHCSVQINTDETAIIGGIFNLNNNVNNDILVYNWKNNTWRIGGHVPVMDFSLQACGLIKDPRTGHFNVLVVGGDPEQPSPLVPTWTWDPITGIMKNITTFPSDTYSGLRMVQFSDYEVLVLNPQDGLLQSFTLEDGWHQIAFLPTFKTASVIPLLVPKGLFKCQSVH